MIINGLCWTYVTGTLVIETYSRGNRKSLNIVNKVLKDSPKITGSEKDTEY